MKMKEIAWAPILKWLDQEGFDVSNANLVELRNAIEEERLSGISGSDIDIILNLNDSIGLQEFGIYEK